MSWADRVVEFPNRVKLYAVSGQDNVYDIEANEGTVYTEGTLLNAANLTGETNELIDEKLETYDTNHKWRFLGRKTGMVNLFLPTDDSWDEVFVKVFFGLNPNYAYTFSAPRPALNPTGDSGAGSSWANGGYGGPNDWTIVSIIMTQDLVRLTRYVWANQDCTASSYWDVYVR